MFAHEEFHIETLATGLRKDVDGYELVLEPNMLAMHPKIFWEFVQYVAPMFGLDLATDTNWEEGPQTDTNRGQTT